LGSRYGRIQHLTLNYEMPDEKQVSGLSFKFQRKCAIILKRSLLRFKILSHFRLKKFERNPLKAFRNSKPNT